VIFNKLVAKPVQDKSEQGAIDQGDGLHGPKVSEFAAGKMPPCCANLRPVKTETGPYLQPALEALRRGDLCAIPTETVYGLAANALDADAVVRIFEVKRRPAFDPLIVHVKSVEAAREVVAEWPEKAQLLAQKFWPGPLTLVLPRTSAIPDIVTSGLPTVGVRMPAHPVTLELLQYLDFPLAAPSANPFGYISPTTAAHVNDQLSGAIPYILDGGPCAVGIESTIVDCSGDVLRVLRLGGLPVDAIRRVVGEVEINLHSTSNPQAPGMLTAHYAPRKPLELVDEFPDAALIPADTRLLAWRTLPYGTKGEVLSSTGNLHEAARELFAALRRLDTSDCSRIIAQNVPNEGIGLAINDRLRRASAGSSH
jgi:L-threonylcarbamoyladenylate synthase